MPGSARPAAPPVEYRREVEQPDASAAGGAYHPPGRVLEPPHKGSGKGFLLDLDGSRVEPGWRGRRDHNEPERRPDAMDLDHHAHLDVLRGGGTRRRIAGRPG